MVSGSPALVAQRTAAETELKTTRPLRVLWCDRELGRLIPISLGSSTSLVEVAFTPQPQLDELGPIPTHTPALSAGSCAYRAFGFQTRSEPLIR